MENEENNTEKTEAKATRLPEIGDKVNYTLTPDQCANYGQGQGTVVECHIESISESSECKLYCPSPREYFYAHQGEGAGFWKFES